MTKIGKSILLSILLVVCFVFAACGGGGVDVEGTYTINHPTNSAVTYTVVIGSKTVTLTYTDAANQTVTYSGTYTSDKDGNVEVTYTVDNVEKTVSFSVSESTLTFKSGELVYVAGLANYTVTFKNGDDVIGTPQTILAGGAATAPADPTKEGYRFTGWDVTFNNVTADIIVNAVFVKTYTVTFKNGTETIGTPQVVDTGTAATAPANPTKAGYLFTGWDVAFNNVTSDLTVNAVFVQVFTVTFKNGTETIGTPQTVQAGGSATAPADPTKEGHVFKGWDVAFDNITADLTVNAEFVVDQNVFYVTETLEGTTLKIKIEVKGSNITFDVFEAKLTYNANMTFVSNTESFLGTDGCNNVAEQSVVNMAWILTSGNQTTPVVIVELTFTVSEGYSYAFSIVDLAYDNGVAADPVDAPYAVID